MLAYR